MVLIWFASATMAAGANEMAAMNAPLRTSSSLSKDRGEAAVGAPSQDTASITTPEPNTNSTRYEGGKWISGSTVTWSIANAPGTEKEPYSGYIGQEYKGYIERSFQTWSAASGLTFQEVTDSQAADIRLGWGQFDTASSGVVGHTGCQAIDGAMLPNGIIRLEDPAQTPLTKGDNGILTYSGTTASFYQVALHEIGHALGLDDNNDPASIMYFEAIGSKTALSNNDVAGIQSLYASSPAQKPVLQASAAMISQSPESAKIVPARIVTASLHGNLRVQTHSNYRPGTKLTAPNPPSSSLK
jgi:predicted Zn-dependent protease